MINPGEIIVKAKPLSQHPSQINQNSDWVNLPGAWMTNLILILAIRIAFSVVPGISTEIAWTLANVTYLVGHFIMFHWLVGTPFDWDAGEFDGLTLWEQMDNGEQFTPSKKFLTIIPIAMFLVSTHYTHYDATLFFINLIPLIIVLIAKLPAMHRVRIFGINMDQTVTDGSSNAMPPSGRVTRSGRSGRYSSSNKSL